MEWETYFQVITRPNQKSSINISSMKEKVWGTIEENYKKANFNWEARKGPSV